MIAFFQKIDDQKREIELEKIQRLKRVFHSEVLWEWFDNFGYPKEIYVSHSIDSELMKCLQLICPVIKHGLVNNGVIFFSAIISGFPDVACCYKLPS